MADFGEKLGDLIVGRLGSLAASVVPEHLKRQVKAGLADFNPFDIIKGNHDLTRAVRIAWIEAALQVLDAARATRRGSTGNAPRDAVIGRGGQPDAVLGFVDVAEDALKAIRHAAWDRRGHVGDTPIDRHVERVLAGAPGSASAIAKPEPVKN